MKQINEGIREKNRLLKNTIELMKINKTTSYAEIAANKIKKQIKVQDIKIINKVDKTDDKVFETVTIK